MFVVQESGLCPFQIGVIGPEPREAPRYIREMTLPALESLYLIAAPPIVAGVHQGTLAHSVFPGYAG